MSEKPVVNLDQDEKPKAVYTIQPKTSEEEIKTIDHDVQLNPISRTWFYIDQRDQIKYEYDEKTKAWFPMYDEDLVQSQQSIYDSHESQEPIEPKPIVKEKSKREKRETGQEHQPKQRVNSSVYVSGLPKDVTTDELKETFGKFGLFMNDFTTGLPKIKIYQNKEGLCKGDALITYLKEESVDLAVQLLDDTQLRALSGCSMKAEFIKKESTNNSDDKKYNKLDSKTKKMRISQQEKQLDWFEKEEKSNSERYQKVVLLKYMFTPEEIDKDPTLLIEIKEDIRSECEKVGEVTNKSKEGACTVRFKEPLSALACIKLMNGRFFSGRRVSATIYDGTKYEKTTAADDNENSERLENYAKWLEQGKE